MPVYVDDMKAPFRRYIMCHMIATTDDELHAMADRIGVLRKWHQDVDRHAHSHYDISMSKRALAVDYGAIEITWRQCGAMLSIRRATGIMPAPETAETCLKIAFAASRLGAFDL